jgi:hypothetical protein
MDDQGLKKNRKNYQRFAEETYAKIKFHRGYALTDESKRTLSTLAAAIFTRRKMEGRPPDAEPSPQAEFIAVITALANAGVNVLQSRPTDPKPLPQVWRNPLNNEPLKAPRGIAERSLLQKLDPDLLQMFDQLEKEPYQTVHAMREAEAKRAAMAAISYDENAHEANPFRRNDQTAMAELHKRDPLLGSFCQQEARPVELNLFGAKRDLTARGKLFRDPAAATIELAEKIDSQWRLDDRRQAAEQKTEAERRLAELSLADAPQPSRLVQRARIGAE